MLKEKPPESIWDVLQNHTKEFCFGGKSNTTLKSQIISPIDILGYTPHKTQLEWVDWAFDMKNPRKLFLGARGYGKTDMLLLYGIVKALCQNPSLTFLVLCRTIERSTQLVAEIAQHLRKAGFSLTHSKGSFTIKGALRQNPKQPTITPLSLNGRTKGHHADFLFLDDPLDPLDLYMSRIARRVRKVYDESFNITKNLVVIGQYIGAGDLYTQIEDKVDTLRAWHGTLPFLDISKEEFLKTGTLSEWGCNYGGVVLSTIHAPLAPLKVVDSPVGKDSIAFLDVALGGGDYNALSIGWFWERKMVCVGFVFKESYLAVLPQILTLCQNYGVKKAYYENNGIGDAIYRATDGFFKEEHHHTPKVFRIRTLEGPFFRGELVLHSQSDPKYIEMVKNYNPEGTLHDDAPDSLASLYNIMRLFQP